MWGQVHFDVQVGGEYGIIPTRVGTRLSALKKRLYLRDHPHACGDKRSDIRHERLLTGSSPRVWGQGSALISVVCSTGIIPTRVGTSKILHENGTITRDHPHACGDKTAAFARSGSISGSSPRVWGQVDFILDGQYFRRIIPTRVGTSDFQLLFVFFVEDHPHACGDKSRNSLLSVAVKRIIPTRVGTSGSVKRHN